MLGLTRLSSSLHPERMILSCSIGKITGPFKCRSCLIFVAYAMVTFNSAMLFVIASGLSSVHPTVRLTSEVALSRLLMFLRRQLLTFDPVDAVLAVRVLVVIKKLLLLNQGVSDELGSNLLELCTTLLVDTSGASSSVMIKPSQPSGSKLR